MLRGAIVRFLADIFWAIAHDLKMLRGAIVRFLADIFWAIAHDLKIIAAHALHANSTMV